MSVLIHTRAYEYESIRPLSNDERRAEWASKYFAAGHHRTPRSRACGCSLPLSAPAASLPARNRHEPADYLNPAGNDAG